MHTIPAHVTRVASRFLALVLVLAATSSFARSQIIGDIEAFALADDRAAVLEALIPGTADFYYYHCLHYQNTGELERVEPLLATWTERHRGDSRIPAIRNRQAVLLYDSHAAESIQRLTRILNLTWPHQPEPADRRTAHAVRLDPAVLDRTTWLRNELAHERDGVNGFEPTAFEWLLNENIGPARLRHLLSRLSRPDYPKLVEHIANDLRWERSRGFGHHPVHAMLTLAQLEDLRRRMPDLAANDTYIRTVLAKLHPGPETDIDFDRAARRIWLDRLQSFVDGLPPAQNALKALGLYHQLELDRREGRESRERFNVYVRLPRHLPYVNERWIRPLVQRGEALDLRADYRDVTGLPPIGNDEPLVRAYLLHFLRDADDLTDLAPYIRENYLQAVWAEAKLLAGQGDPERWYSMLTPNQVQNLRDRIDIDFAPTNPEMFQPGDAVQLAVDVKNVERLMVRVYRVNALNYYRLRQQEIDTSIDLDGLDPSLTETHAFTDPPIRRIRRNLDFPQIRDPGVYVIDLIGNGRSSRALVRLGTLNYTLTPGPAGHVFRVHDETGRIAENAAILLGARRYTADEHGRIRVPYSTNPGRRAVVMEQGVRVALDFFDHAAEQYELQLGVHVEREALIARQNATLILRPVLRLNGRRIPVGLLNPARLTLTCTDLDGIPATQTIEPFDLGEGDAIAHTFRVPPRLRSITVALQADIPATDGSGDITLQTPPRTLNVNAITETDRIAMPLLARDGTDYHLELRGRNGEPLPHHPVRLAMKHRDFTREREFTLQSDTTGRILLGPLPAIAAISVTTAQSAVRRWQLESDRDGIPTSLTAAAEQPLHLPWMDAAPLSRASAGLLERVQNAYRRDRFDALSVEDGILTIGGLEPGDYELVLKRDERRIRIRVNQGPATGSHRISRERALEIMTDRLLAMPPVDADNAEIRIRLAHASEAARVHLVATHYAGAFDAFDDLHLGVPAPETARLPKSASVYVTGRDIGDEYRYVLDRHTLRRFPGNMLTRPGLILNPWAVRDTETGEQRAAPGDPFGARQRALRRSAEHLRVEVPEPHPASTDLADVDFLADPAFVAINLRPDAEGWIRIDRAQLGARNWVRVVAMDGDQTLVRSLGLPREEPARRERRLTLAIDPDRHAIQQRDVRVVDTGDSLVVNDPTDADVELYDSLAQVFRLFATLAEHDESINGGELAEFRFLTEWPTLPADRRRDLYHRYAGHEVHFFLYHKDRAFFDAIIRPYLANKHDKTFLDDYLLGGDLTPYRDPGRFARLNALERILLGRRLADAARQGIEQHIADRVALLPPDPDRDHRLFELALRGGAMETAGAAAELREAVDALAEAPVQMRGLHAARAAGAPPAPASSAPMRAIAMAAVAAEADGAMPAAPPTESVAGARRQLADAFAERKAVRALYRDVPPTQEWAEQNYYRVLVTAQNPERIAVNAFWLDYARHNPAHPFRSTHFVEAAGSLSEILMALAVLDLPFSPEAHSSIRDEAEQPGLRAESPMIVFSRRIQTVTDSDSRLPVLISQNVFKQDDRIRIIDNEPVDHYITDGFVIHTVYGLRIVLTNPTSTPQTLDLLAQIPEGALPLGGARSTTGRHVRLGPFKSVPVEILFYFPEPGTFRQFPAHAARRGTLVAATEPMRFDVAAEPGAVDRESWEHVSQRGSTADVLAYLDAHNIEDLDLERIAWRMRDADTFTRILERLDARWRYQDTLWSYSLMHNRPERIRQYLERHDFANRCGAAIRATLLHVDPVERQQFQFLEYDPLVNARAHPLGAQRRIVNDALYAQYHKLLEILAHRPALDDADRLAVVYYLLVQDRIHETLEHFARINPDALSTRLQYDALQAYLAFFTRETGRARAIAERYRDYPVRRWAERFRAMLAQLDEIEGLAHDNTEATEPDRDRRQDRLAATDPSLEFSVEAGRILLISAQVNEITLNYYRMDIELLFSGQPFLQDYGDRFAYVEPSHSETISVPPGQDTLEIELPQALRGGNLLIEARTEGLRRHQLYFPNAMTVRLMENYGHLRVTRRTNAHPLDGAYVKVYARDTNGEIRFHKDGYTDLRGRFDYASVSGETPAHPAERFSILVLSETDGAVVREADPPLR